MTEAAPNPVADERYDKTIRPNLMDLVEELVGIEEPLVRLAVIARLEERLGPVIDSLKTFAVREANEAGESFATIGAVIGVSPQRAHQLARNPEENITP